MPDNYGQQALPRWNKLMNKLMITVQRLMIALAISLISPPIIANNHNESTDAYNQKMILYYVNAYRAKHHLSPLTMNNAISKEAAQHSRDMATKKMGFGHTGFSGRIKRLYRIIPQCNGGAENVALYKLDAKKLVDAWIASPGHRRNIEGHYNLTGIGIAHGRTGWAYYTQMFIRSNT